MSQALVTINSSVGQGGILVASEGEHGRRADVQSLEVAVSDHGKPMKLTSGSGKVTVFNGNDSKEAPLALAGDKLEAKGAFKIEKGTKVLAEVSVNGKPSVSARVTLK